MQKWLVSRNGKAIGVGDTIAEALGQALQAINKAKYIWK